MKKTDCVVLSISIVCVTAILLGIIFSATQVSVARANRGVADVSISRSEIVKPAQN